MLTTFDQATKIIKSAKIAEIIFAGWSLRLVQRTPIHFRKPT